MIHPSIHTFSIPVMGLAYTIDSPIRMAHFGISSVISIMDDELIEKMNAFKNNLSGGIQYYMDLFGTISYFKIDELKILQQIKQFQYELNEIKIPEPVIA